MILGDERTGLAKEAEALRDAVTGTMMAEHKWRLKNEINRSRDTHTQRERETDTERQTRTQKEAAHTGAGLSEYELLWHT